jgi:hypothetical protein
VKEPVNCLKSTKNKRKIFTSPENKMKILIINNEAKNIEEIMELFNDHEIDICNL